MMVWWHNLKKMTPWYKAEVAASEERAKRLQKVMELDDMVRRSLILLDPKRHEPPTS